ncbi:MAG: hypothetical protein JW820_09010 [Spirochaetales bacterium]|nr:hypothetical protein [Spirochaetales bacterium]
MDDLLNREYSLRRRIARVNAAPPSRSSAPSQAQERFRRFVEPAVQEIDHLLEDYLCGRTEEERARMLFEARLSLPVYSHLRGLFVGSSTRG